MLKSGTQSEKLLSVRPAEANVILLCSRIRLEPGAKEKLQAVLRDDLDWQFIYRQAFIHGVSALVHRNLVQVQEFGVPRDVLEAMSERNRQIAWNNLYQTQQLIRLLEKFDAAGIDVMPFKGPALAGLVYGDPVLRPFTDIDILVRREDIHAAKKVLLENEYAPLPDFADSEEAHHIDSQMGYPFVRADSRVSVELHWAFLNTCHSFQLNPDDVWARRTEEKLAGRSINSFSPEDLLLYLCAHGTKHLWERVSWIVDVAELLRAYDMDWESVFARAATLGSERMLNLGLLLAADLLDAEIPEHIIDHVNNDHVARGLAQETLDQWVFRKRRDAALSLYAVFSFLFRSRERWQDRVPYSWHHVKLVIAPSEQDHGLIKLPKGLSFLYFVVRPVRLLGNLLGRPFRHTDGGAKRNSL